MRVAEVKEDALHEALGLPPWITFTKASCSAVQVRVSWTKMKHVPVHVVRDNLRMS